jgi:hypothetical protein
MSRDASCDACEQFTDMCAKRQSGITILCCFVQLVFEDAIVGPSDFISPVYSLWATFISLYIAHYVVERSTGWALAHGSPKTEEEPKVNAKPKKVNRPDFQPMVPWYSGSVTLLLTDCATQDDSKVG